MKTIKQATQELNALASDLIVLGKDEDNNATCLIQGNWLVLGQLFHDVYKQNPDFFNLVGATLFAHAEEDPKAQQALITLVKAYLDGKEKRARKTN